MSSRVNSIPVLREFNESRRLLYVPELHVDAPFDCFRFEEVWLTSRIRQEGFFQPAFRQDFYDISLFLEAGFTHGVNQYRNTVVGSSINFVAPGQLQAIANPPETLTMLKGYTLFFKPSFLQIGVDNLRFSREFPFYNITQNAYLSLSDTDVTFFADLFERILHEHRSGQPYSEGLVRSLLLSVLYYAKRLFARQQPAPIPPTTDRAGQLTEAYQQLLHAHVNELTTVGQYAERLHVSPDYLKECTNKAMGKSAQALLHEARLLEAQSLLAQTSASVAEIAYQLGFENPANFIHFFKRMAGITPLAFRLQLNAI